MGQLAHGDDGGWGWGPTWTDEAKDAAAERTAQHLAARPPRPSPQRRDPSTYVDLDIVAERLRAEAVHASALAILDRRAEHAARVRALDAPTIPIPPAPAAPLTGTPDTDAAATGATVAVMNRQQLREECRRRGVSQQGTTDDLRQRLTRTEPDTRAGIPGTAMSG